ncbi:MAG: hypothetical protein ABS49_00325 [Erythrobacter sp. SCN 62-14]|nr:MAG: hypothetical protein ABS49_00325 [Erythrobacter sp. SCN 62-14]
MAQRADRKAWAQRAMPLYALTAVAMLALPTASLALAGTSRAEASIQSLGLNVFTPASVDPVLAARIADKAEAKGIRFTPARSAPVVGQRTVTVAVRVDDDRVQAISVRRAIDTAPGRLAKGNAIAGLQASKFELGAARGYKSFARVLDLSPSAGRMAMPDLAEFEPSRPQADDKPSRLQPRIGLEGREIAGRSPNTLDSLASQTVDLGGSYRLSPKLDVRAGVRISQERDRLDPLTNSIQDSQAVYVGTQLKF